jgi:hypothetical protein
MTICIKCGCTDERACIGGCHWTRISDASMERHGTLYRGGELGICSACDDGTPIQGFILVDQFDSDEDLMDDSTLILPGDPDFDFYRDEFQPNHSKVNTR